MAKRTVPSRWGPRWSRWVGRFLARVYWNATVVGLDNVPAEGPVVVVANHIGFIDGPVLHGVLRRRSHFLITADMFRGPLKVILTGAGQIQVRDSGRDALAAARAILDRGDVVGVFPEGTRGAGTADAVHGGAAWLALHAGAPVVPVALLGTRLPGESVNVWPRPRRRIVIDIGQALVLKPPVDLTGRARASWSQQQVGDALRAQVAHAVATHRIPLPTDVNPVAGQQRKVSHE